MDTIEVKQPTQEELEALGIENWNSWGCEPSTFDWEYPGRETAYVHEGRVTVKHKDGETEIKAGDLVVFPKGMKCTWIVHEAIRKVYTIEDF